MTLEAESVSLLIGRIYDAALDPQLWGHVKNIGGKIWVDLQCKLLHLGQHNFRGDLAETLRLQGRW
jgi:hypothetical protein